MIIFFKDYDKKPDIGDIKVLKNGDTFIRGHAYVRMGGQYYTNSTGGRPNFAWYPLVRDEESNRFECIYVERIRKQYRESGLKGYRSRTTHKSHKIKILNLDMRVKEDREKYMSIFNCTEISPGIDTVKLSMNIAA
ncbi:hypothetical protein LMH73_020170 [Vibrio splendidus]|nr:hypothetical protein [Vibrio splendidus]MCC4880483.1 hypothetical protein [Vibrio splendidus]